MALILLMEAIWCCIGGHTGSILSAGERISDPAKDSLEIQCKERPASCFQIEISGILASRMAFNLAKLINLRQIHTKYAGWGADQIGRWIGTTILEATLLDRDTCLSIIEEKVYELIRAQDLEGFYYGAELAENPDRYRQCWFGQGRGIWNMLEYYNITRDGDAFLSLVRAAEYTVAKRSDWEISRPLSGGIESAAGPMARLGAMIQNQDFIDWSKNIADHIQHEVAVPSAVPTAHVESTNLYTHEMRPLFHHTHSYLSTTHGVVDLSVITGEKKYFNQAKKVFDDSYSSVWINGTFPESYGDLYERIDETCSTVDWLYLALKLFSVTGEARYLDAAELTAMNGLLFGQNNLGGFDTYRSINRHFWADSNNWGGEQRECCTMSGGWGLAQVALYTITANDRGIGVNLPFDAAVEFPSGKGSIKAVQKIVTGEYQLIQDIRVNNSTDANSHVRIRIPYWSESAQVYVNDKLTDIPVSRGFVEITCLKDSALHIVCIHPMKFNEIPPRRSLLSHDMPGAAGDASEVGIQYGPFVLMYYRELFPFPDKQISLDIPLDAKGKPFVSQAIPLVWQQKGAVPLLIEASLNSKGRVYLMPCANLPLLRFIQTDPYVLRFSDIGFRNNGSADNWLVLPPPMINTGDALFRDSTLVTIESILPVVDIYYTLDGTEPSGDSFLYPGPFCLERSAFVKARSISFDGTESEIGKAYCRNRSELIKAFEITRIEPGLQYSYYEGNWRYLPDFEALTPVKSGTVPNFDINGIHPREDNFAIRFTGYIDIPADGVYTFFSLSDDGTKIYIGDLPIVYNDGTHGPIEESGDVNLQKGMHKIEVQYFESTLGQEMHVFYKGPGISKTEIPGSLLYMKQE